MKGCMNRSGTILDQKFALAMVMSCVMGQSMKECPAFLHKTKRPDVRSAASGFGAQVMKLFSVFPIAV